MTRFLGEVEARCVHPLDDRESRDGLLDVVDTNEARGLENGLARRILEIQQHLKCISRSS